MKSNYKEPKYMQEYEIALINGEKYKLLEPYDIAGEDDIINWYATAKDEEVRCIDNLGVMPDIYFQKRSVVRIAATRVIRMDADTYEVTNHLLNRE